MVSLADTTMRAALLQKGERDEGDKPRHVYRIRKTDYVKLPPIKHSSKVDRKVCSRLDEDTYEEQLLDLERYVKDLLPDIACHPTTLRATAKSPVALSETDLSLWRQDQQGRQRRSELAHRYLYKLGQKILSEQSDFNRDMLNKEVEIKRILETHRPTLLRSLRNLGRHGRLGHGSEATLEVEGRGGCTSSPSDSYGGSTLADSALGDSAFGLWEGSLDQDLDTDYLPSQRTLVTGEQERSAVLHSLTEFDKVEPEPPVTEEGTDIADTEDERIEEEMMDTFVEEERPPSVKYPPKPSSPTPSPVMVTKPATPKLPTPAPIEEEEPEEKVEVEEEEEVVPIEVVVETHVSPAVEEKEVKEEVPPGSAPSKMDGFMSIDLPSAMSTKHDNGYISSELPSALSTKTSVGESRAAFNRAESDDILGINAMLADTDDEVEDEGGESVMEEEEALPSSSESSYKSSEPVSISPPQVYVYKPPPKEKTPDPPTPTPPPPASPSPPLINSPPVLSPVAPERKPLPKPKARSNLKRLQEEDAIAARIAHAVTRAKLRSQEKEKERDMELEAVINTHEEFTGNENVDEILERFTIVDKSRLNYLYKIFHDYIPDEHTQYLSHQEMKRALSQLKSCTKISRNQLKFIEMILGLNKDRITFHTFTVMATLIDHMSHKDPATLAMFDSIDITRMEHDLPRLKRLFHCVSERDDFGWPKLTTKAMDIELRAACVPEHTRSRLIRELDPTNRGEITIFDFIVYTPLWIYLHDGIVDNPFNEIAREVASPVHRRWGVSVLWLPEQTQAGRDPRASPASGCGSERSTPPFYSESPRMRTVQGEGSYSESENDTEGIANSDDDD